MRGDKRDTSILDKAMISLPTPAIPSSANYRFSPNPISLSNPNQVRVPDHPHDVGEALRWLDRNVTVYGGDPTRIVLIGHSAGAHLVSLVGTDPTYLEAYRSPPR